MNAFTHKDRATLADEAPPQIANRGSAPVLGGRSMSTGSFLTPNVPGTAREHPIAIWVPILLEDDKPPMLRGGSVAPRGNGPAGMKWVMECGRPAIRNGPVIAPAANDQRGGRAIFNVLPSLAGPDLAQR